MQFPLPPGVSEPAWKDGTSPGREVVEGLARDQHDPPRAGRAIADGKLDDGSPGVVADEGRVTQVEAVKELRGEARYPGSDRPAAAFRA